MNHIWDDCGVSISKDHYYAGSMIFEMDEVNYFESDDNSSISSHDDSSCNSFTYSERADGSIIIHMDEINTYGDISDNNCSLSSQESDLDEEQNLADEIFDDIEMIVTGCTSESSRAELDIMYKRALERAMNKTQEVWNAVTMLIAPCYCLYYLFSGHWLSIAHIENYRLDSVLESYDSSFSSGKLDFLGGNHGCIQSSIFPNLHALPPLSVIAIIAGMVLHAPASITYHLLCAYRIPAGPQRIDHWSRRLDQAMIHVISILWSFGSSGNWKYTLLSILLNVDSIYGLYQRPFCPRKIVRRFAIALIVQSLPLFVSGDGFLTAQLILIFAASGWLFTRYPLGGYSHGMFHIVIAFAPPLFLAASTQLPNMQSQIRFAAACAVSNVR